MMTDYKIPYLLHPNFESDEVWANRKIGDKCPELGCCRNLWFIQDLIAGKKEDSVRCPIHEGRKATQEEITAQKSK